jgi:hypothetical protein
VVPPIVQRLKERKTEADEIDIDLKKSIIIKELVPSEQSHAMPCLTD